MDQILDSYRSSTYGWLKGTIAGWVTFLLAGILIGLPIILYVWLRNLTATYEVTDERLIIRRGIFTKSIDEIELYRIKDVRLDFSLINEWAGIGTLTISSSDETTADGDLVIKHVAKAKERREQMRRLVDTARQKRRVREVDLNDEPLG